MKRFLALSLVLTVILMACTLTACSLFGGNDTTNPCKNGHTWEDHEDLGEATCTMSGSVFKKCSVCGIKQEFTTPPIGHQLKDKNVYVAPTCTEEGYKGTAICTRSGCDYVDNLEIIPTVDHKYGKWISVGDGTHKKVCSYDSNHVLIEECSGGTATCSSQATCRTCGGKYGELGTEHKFNKKIATEEYLNTEATCIELATYFYSCECGEIGDETFEYGDLADHDYVDGLCSVCGEADPTVSISLEGTYTATDDWSNSFAVVVTADTITFTPPMGNEVVVNYTYENGIVTLYADGSEITNPAAMSLTITDGALVGMMYNGNTYTITVGGAGEEPEDPEVLPGTFVVVDNNMGVLSGTYGYTIGENNAVTVTKDGEDCSDFMFSVDMGGYWMVQCSGTGPMAQYLCDAEGNHVTELAGELSVNYLMNGLYVYTFPASEGGEEDPEEGGDGTEANPYVVDDMPASITFESDTINKVYYIFTASQTGAITFTWPNADSWYGITELDANGDNTANTTSGYETTSFSFDVTEGTKYRVELGTWMIAGEVTITVTYGEAGGEEPEDPELDAFAGTYTYNDFTLTFDGQGNGVYNNGSDWAFTYTVYADVASISDFAAYDDGENSATLTETGVDVHFSGSFGDDVFNASFTKQAESEEPELPALSEGIYYYNANGWDSVYAYAWTEVSTPDLPMVGDYVIMGVNGDWTTEGSIKLTKNGDQYEFKGLRLAAGTAFKIVYLGTNSNTYYDAVETWVSVAYTKDTDGNIVVTNEGIYDFYFKTATNELYFGTGSNESTPNMKVESTTITEVWPGTQMTAVEGYDGWFYMETIEADYVIFNNGLAGEEAAQTANILMDDTYTFYNEGWVESIA